MADLSTQVQRDFPDWVLRDGAWLVFTKDSEGNLVLVWPTSKDGPEGLLRTKVEATTLAGYLRDKGNQVFVMRLGPNA